MPLREIDLRSELQRLSKRGYIPTVKDADSGVGETLEQTLGLKPTNKVGIPDCLYRSVPTELKAHRAEASSMITLFCKEPKKSNRFVDLRTLIRTYGYTDDENRPSLRVTISSRDPNAQGFQLFDNPTASTLDLRDREGRRLWWWTPDQFSPKLSKQLVLVYADSRLEHGREEFWYRKATLYRDLDTSRFPSLVTSGEVTVDLRAYIKPDGSVRNHGTGFRIRDFSKLAACYRSSEPILV